MSNNSGFITTPTFFSYRDRCAKRYISVAKASHVPPPDVNVDQPTRVRDNPFGQFCISTFRSVMQPQIGWKSRRHGYDGLIEECRMLLARKGPQEQQRVVRNTLDTLFQAPHGPAVFRKYFSGKPGLNAKVTPVLFQWLVGDCYANRPEEGGYGVYIEKCRFLEESGCKGLCVNMCQQPTQRYFKEVLGLPVRMTPNYEDMSCQMTYGVQPLPIDEDPAVTGDCLENCKMTSSVRLRGDPTCYVSKES
ncbi:unnamed protein product [Agarophyton chilense]